jgi:hypothetical protein
VDVSESYIEDCIGRQEPLTKVLRLLCLYSLTVGGLKDKQYQHFANELIQVCNFSSVKNPQSLPIFIFSDFTNLSLIFVFFFVCVCSTDIRISIFVYI